MDVKHRNILTAGRLNPLMRDRDGSRWLVALSALSMVVLLAAGLVAVASARGCGFERACEDIPRGVACEAAGARLEEQGAVLWGWGGTDLTTPASMSWGRDLFPLRRQSCTVTLDFQCRVTAVQHESWFTYGPSEYQVGRMRAIIRGVLR